MPKLKLHWQILIALVIAVLLGYFFPAAVKYTSILGDIFLRALKMVIVPLIFSSIVSGVTSIGSGKNLGRIGLKTISYYLATSILAIMTGLIFANTIRPGVGVEMGFSENVTAIEGASGKVLDILVRIVPENIIDSMARGDILPIIFFAIVFGFFITQVQEKYSRPLTNFFEGVFEVMMKLTTFVIRFAPLGILGIVSREVVRNADKLGNIAGGLAIYMLTVIVGLAVHAIITLPAIVKFLGKANPVKHFKNMATALLTAFSTASSSATLPLTMEAVEEKDGISNKISSFTLPLGATINMDGTALYECIAVIFIAQVYGVDLSFYQQFIIVLTSMLVSIGAAGIPMAGLVMLTVILSAVNLPLEGVGLILSVDIVLDMMRTTVNVWSDSCGAVVIAKSEGEKLLI
ncbi:MAG: dicarboxylate/amino acid:cation symporter [Prolixibacteraceae bacterium]|nr:dicarboxylate/amino acid:cation symporter [Prolixibacteraceae bacterium]